MKTPLSFLFPVFLVFVSSFRSSQAPLAPLPKDNRLLATGWYALSAEKEACYLQTYRLATLQLEQMAKEKSPSGKSWALVTDLDETLLDNSAWSVKVLLEGTDYPTHWSDWEKAGKAPAFPGAIGFYSRVAALNIPVFYISNRSRAHLGATLSNLRKLGLPNADSSHVLLKESSSNKIARREKVLKNHEILMLLGDNLADFDGIWEDAKGEARKKAVQDNTANWGNRFILFPNPMYGGWKEDLFAGLKKPTPTQQDSVWRQHLGRFLKEAGF